MRKPYPSLRGWSAVGIGLFAALALPMILPGREGLTSKFTRPPTIGMWVAALLVVVVCLLLCLLTANRGSRADKVAAIVGCLVTLLACASMILAAS